MAAAEETPPVRPAPELLAWSRGLVHPALRQAVDTMPAPMRRIAGYHLGWWDERGGPAGGAGGRAIRPALTLLAASAVRGDVAAAVPAAVAVELAHNFALLHGDLMDGGLARRHRRSAWAVFGRRNAILAGDALLTLAVDVLVASRQPAAVAGLRTLSAAVLDLLRGQHAGQDFERRDDVELAECQHMAEGRTGALFGCAGWLGALFGGGTAAQAERLALFGRRLGLAVQHVDDLLGIWGDPAATGRPARSDLDSRRKSLPVVAALASGTAAGHELATLYRRTTPLSTGELVHAAKLVAAAGGRAWSQAQTGYLLGQTLEQLRSAGLAERPSAELATLARLAVDRAGPDLPADSGRWDS